jgi:hypothetical protein
MHVQEVRKLFFDGDLSIAGYHETCSYGKVSYDPADSRIVGPVEVGGLVCASGERGRAVRDRAVASGGANRATGTDWWLRDCLLHPPPVAPAAHTPPVALPRSLRRRCWPLVPYRELVCGAAQVSCVMASPHLTAPRTTRSSRLPACHLPPHSPHRPQVPCKGSLTSAGTRVSFDASTSCGGEELFVWREYAEAAGRKVRVYRYGSAVQMRPL